MKSKLSIYLTQAAALALTGTTATAQDKPLLETTKLDRPHTFYLMALKKQGWQPLSVARAEKNINTTMGDIFATWSEK